MSVPVSCLTTTTGAPAATSRGRVLHVGNIAHNAYTNAVTLAGVGYDCNVMSYDNYHFASAPEMMALPAGVAQPEFKDQYYGDFYKLGMDYPDVPDFFAQGPLITCLQYLLARSRGDPSAKTQRCVLEYLKFKCIKTCTAAPFELFWPEAAFQEALADALLPEQLAHRIQAGRLAERILFFMQARHELLRGPTDVPQFSPPLSPDFLRNFDLPGTMLDSWIATLQPTGMLKALGLEHTSPAHVPPPLLAEAGYREYLNLNAAYWRDLCAQYDHCIFYGESCIFPYLAGVRGYCALEHGTIRCTPLEDNEHGRLVRDAYLAAKAVFITNADYITANPRLEFRPGQAIFLPHPFHEGAAARHRATFTGFPRAGEPCVFLCPARQDWVMEDMRLAKGNDCYFRAAAQLVAEGINDFQMRCVAWGRDLDASRQLVAELGIAEQVEWVQPMAKRQLWDAKLAANAVIDQFRLPAMGGVIFEALGLGCRVITHDDGSCNAPFFGSQPPIMSAYTVEEIATRMKQVLTDPLDEVGIGKQAMNWVGQYHSEKRNVELQERAFAMPA